MKKEKRSTETISREDFVKKKFRKSFFFLLLLLLSFSLVSLLLTCIFGSHSKRDYLLLIITTLVLFTVVYLIIKKYLLCYLFNIEFDRFSMVNFVNTNLSSKKYTEVFPIQTSNKYSYFFINITDIAKFYAIIIDESTLSVYLKFNTENEYRFLENINKDVFSLYYKL